MSRLTKWVGTTAVAGVSAFTVFSGTANGFFPPIPTGNNTPTTTPIVTSPPATTSPIISVPPPPFVVPPPIKVVVPPVVVPPPYCYCDPKPHTVPEPATLVTAAVGLSLAAVGAVRRKLRGKKAESQEL